MEVCAIWFQKVSLSHRWSIYQDKIVARWLIKRKMSSPVSRLEFGPSIAPFVGVSSYALEVEHVFLPVGERREWAWLMFIESLWSRLWRMEAAQLLGRVSIVRLAFAPKRARKDKRARGCLGKTHHFQIISCSVVKCDSRSCSTATTIWYRRESAVLKGGPL